MHKVIGRYDHHLATIDLQARGQLLEQKVHRLVEFRHLQLGPSVKMIYDCNASEKYWKLQLIRNGLFTKDKTKDSEAILASFKGHNHFCYFLQLR